jgi:SpoVK/Ycf46/Vps4 family AAA+-type ATPase
VQLVGTAAATYLVSKWIIKEYMSPANAHKVSAYIGKLRKYWKRMGKTEQFIVTRTRDLTQYENEVLCHVLFPWEIKMAEYNQVVGLTNTQERIKMIFNGKPKFEEKKSCLSKSTPKGVLFFGPPGVGKTMLAKCIAKQSGSIFINVPFTLFQQKYFGESSKYIQAIFSLARKLAPAIIFIDELDGAFRSRSYHTSDMSMSVISDFNTHWDGILSNERDQVIVLGATNRREILDSSILRRLPCQFEFRLPDCSDRISLFTKLLEHEKLCHGLCLKTLANKTEKYSHSDIYEVCKAAVRHANDLNKSTIDDSDFNVALIEIKAASL